jgi:multidrug efflux pump subunit AcrB
MRFVLFPPEGIDIFFIRTEAPTATSLERHSQLLKPIEDVLSKLPKEEVKNFTTTVGLVQQDPNDPNSRRGTEYAQIAVYLTQETERKRTAAEIIAALRTDIGDQAGLKSVQFAKVNAGPPTGKPVSIGVRGKEYEQINAAAASVKAILAKVSGVTDISDNYTLGKEELIVNVNAAEATAAGLSVASVGNTVRAAYEGIVATKVRELDEEIDVRVSLAAEQRTDAKALSRISVPNASGSLIPLSQVADISSHRGVAVIGHEANARQVLVTAEVNVKKVSSLEANAAVKAELDSLRKEHPTITFDFGGENKDTQESLESLAGAFGVAIVGIFLILVLTFGSLSQPFVVLLTVPLGIIAVIWAFFLHQMPLSFMGMLGIIALSGVIVNNAIVFVDFVNQRRRDGLDRYASIFDAAGSRLRPIFLTTITTVIGVLPTAYGIGGLDKFVVPIALALGWGIAFGSVMTAFVFPAALAVLDDMVEFAERRGLTKKH